MGRSAALVATALMLAACGSFADVDMSKFTVNPADLLSKRLELESEPAGAEAKTSLGPSCRTPCSLPIRADGDFTVTFALDGYEPQTVSVAPTYVQPKLTGQQTHNAPAYADLDPNPARAVLVAIPPPPEPPEPPPGRRPRGAAQAGKATHVVSAAADLFAGTAPGSVPLRKLNTGTAVTVVRREAGWTLVAREGKVLGYVAAANLIPIQ
jgi:hypothetical protein